MTAKYRAIEALLRSRGPGVTLADLVDERRAASVSWDRIAREIRRVTGECLNGETLRIWFDRPIRVEVKIVIAVHS